MRYGANLAALANVPLAVLFALTVRQGRDMPTSLAIAVAAALVAITIWRFPRGEDRSKFHLYTFLALLGSTMLWVGVVTLGPLDRMNLASIVYTMVEVLIFGGIAVVMAAVFLNYVAIRRERGI